MHSVKGPEHHLRVSLQVHLFRTVLYDHDAMDADLLCHLPHVVRPRLRVVLRDDVAEHQVHALQNAGSHSRQVYPHVLACLRVSLESALVHLQACR